MTVRKRRNPTPDFKMPVPYNPITGKRIPLMVEGEFPYCALMQIAAEDTHENYVICQGFDTRIKKFIYYEDGNPDKPGIAVAKPYGSRHVGTYVVGQVFPAMLPLSRLGQNPGVAETTQGHPADLDELVEILYDDDGVAISWMLIDSGKTQVWGKLDADLDYDDTTGVTVSIWSTDWSEDTGVDAEYVLPPPTMESGTIDSDSWVRLASRGDGRQYVDMAPC